MKNKTLRFVAVFLIGASLLSYGCQPDELKRAAKASDTLAGSINSLILAKRELAKQGKLNRNEELKLTQLLFAFNEAVTVFNNQAKSSKTWDANVKSALTTLFTEVTSTLDQLNTQGVLNITNPEAKKTFTDILIGANAAIAIIKAVLT